MASGMASTRSTSGAVPLVGLLLLGAAGGCATAGNDASTTARPIASRPAPAAHEDDLAMHAERGSIDRDEAEEAITRHWSRLKACYNEAGAATTFAGGSVTLHFDVAIDGRATAVAVQSSRLGNLPVEQCLITAGLEIRFARPHGGGRASLEYSMEFRSTDERKVIDLPDDGTPAVRQALLARLGADCESFAVGTAGAGPWSTTVYIDRHGQVKSAGLAAKLPIESETALCSSRALQRSPFAAATDLGLDGEALGRMTISFNDADLRAAVAAAASTPATVAARPHHRKGKPSERERLMQGRRQHR
jgi:hypothetical protein